MRPTRGIVLCYKGGAHMKNILGELWHGNITPQEDCRNNTPEMKQLMGYMARHHDDLLKTLTDEQRDILSGSTIVGASMRVLRKRQYSCMRFDWAQV